MQLEVVTRKENPLLKRVEVRFKAIHKAEPTPTRDALRAFLAKELNATKDIVVIDSQASTFGRYETHGYAKVYKSKEEALAVERKHILIRNKLMEPEVKEAAAKPEKPAPPPKVEKPAAAPKPETPKPETKPEAKEEKAPSKEEKKAAPKEEKKGAPKEEKKAAEKGEEGKEEKKPEPKKKGGK